MLYLLTTPAWDSPGAAPRLLPATVPGALLVVLATSGAWTSRESLGLIFWPDSAPSDARHHLRVNLHRARAVLAGWGETQALQADRQLLRLVLRSDVAPWQAGMPGDAPLPNPAQWLLDWRLSGHAGFARWCEATAARLRHGWLARSRHLAPGRSSGAAAPPPGRQAEHQRLLASPVRALLLLGEPGAGKTTLLNSAFPNAPCLRGLEGLHGMPYRPLLEALRARIPALQAALGDARHRLRPYRLDLARVLPELAPDEPLPPLDALTAQARLVEVLARAFEALTPVLLVDDLQWCDTATVEWLLMLAHSGRLRWRATARRHEVGPSLAQALRPLREAGHLEELDVAALSRDVLAEVCHTRWPHTPFSPEQLNRLHLLSSGNAFALGELVAAGPGVLDGSLGLPGPVRELVQRRLLALPGLARRAVQAAAVFVQPVPDAALRALASEPAGDADEAGDAAWAGARDLALSAGLLRQEADGLACGHDLIRAATAAQITDTQRCALHRLAALWLAEHPGADAMTIAEHWRSAAEPQTALSWCHRGAEQLKARGRFDEARALWREVAQDSLDAAHSLRARLELAACDMFVDLARGEAALLAVHAQLGAVAEPEQHRRIEGRVLAALVDNRVFAGDLARAGAHALRLRQLLPSLAESERIDALEVLIELAMREPDIPAAWALLAQLRLAAPQRPTLLSFEGQIHWFGGQVQAAHDALAWLLKRHPDYCGGITVENDLAVMLHALGELEQAETMARRSLASWAGVAHTETLSLLVLGSVLTSAGRTAEADAALLRALALAQAQSSAGFEAEARVRRARLLLQAGSVQAAAAELAAAAPLLTGSGEPLRVSQWVLVSMLVALAQGRPPAAGLLARLDEVAARSAHPLVHARAAQLQATLALAAGDAATALAAAERQATLARSAGLQELLAEAWLLSVQAQQLSGQATTGLRALVCEAQALASRQGFADIQQRAQAWLRRF